jgi:hypothetical protein
MGVLDVTEWDGVEVTIMAGTYVSVSKPPKANKYGLKSEEWLDSGEVMDDLTFSGVNIKLTRYVERSYMSLDIKVNGVVYSLSVDKAKSRETVKIVKGKKEVFLIQV